MRDEGIERGELRTANSGHTSADQRHSLLRVTFWRHHDLNVDVNNERAYTELQVTADMEIGGALSAEATIRVVVT